MVSYIVLGLVWCSGLEYYTNTRLDTKWTMRQRLFNSIFWPVSVLIFLVEFFRNI